MTAGTILIIDDDHDVLEIVAAMLSRSFGEVLTADSAGAGLEILRQRQVDLVLAEALLPDMRANELIRRVNESFPFVSVMLMTAFCDEVIDARIPVIEKPFTAAALRRRVEGALARRPKSDVLPPRQ